MNEICIETLEALPIAKFTVAEIISIIIAYADNTVALLAMVIDLFWISKDIGIDIEFAIPIRIISKMLTIELVVLANTMLLIATEQIIKMNVLNLPNLEVILYVCEENIEAICTTINIIP